MKPMTERTWILEDHLCRKCGGRILRCATGNGMTPGGNPVYRCADCGNSASGLGPQCVCWCGFSQRHNDSYPYRCMSFGVLTEFQKLLAAFRNCGCDPERGEVGIVLDSELRKVLDRRLTGA